MLAQSLPPPSAKCDRVVEFHVSFIVNRTTNCTRTSGSSCRHLHSITDRQPLASNQPRRMSLIDIVTDH